MATRIGTANRGYKSCELCGYSSDAGYATLLRHAHRHLPAGQPCSWFGHEVAEHVYSHFHGEEPGDLVWMGKAQGWVSEANAY